MYSVVVAYANLQTAMKIKNVLTAAGFPVSGVCTSASQVLARVNGQENGGIVVSGMRFPDMTGTAMAAMLPPGCPVLLLLAPSQEEVRDATKLPCLMLPAAKKELVAAVRRLASGGSLPARGDKRLPAQKNEEARRLIAQAKEILMEKSGLTESLAHRYLQKKSMDTGRRMEDTAREIVDREK